jgi:hypothetical protein
VGQIKGFRASVNDVDDVLDGAVAQRRLAGDEQVAALEVLRSDVGRLAHGFHRPDLEQAEAMGILFRMRSAIERHGEFDLDRRAEGRLARRQQLAHQVIQWNLTQHQDRSEGERPRPIEAHADRHPTGKRAVRGGQETKRPIALGGGQAFVRQVFGFEPGVRRRRIAQVDRPETSLRALEQGLDRAERRFDLGMGGE